MRYVFRTHAAPAIGAGHVMRLSAIAEEMISRGLHTIFVGEITNMPWLTERIKKVGFAEIHSRTNGFKAIQETDILILDSYEIPVIDKFIQLENWRLVINIFDSSTPQYKCHLRIHPGIEESWERIPDAFTLCGKGFIPLRSGIYKKTRVTNDPLKITIAGGGSDSTNFVGAILKVLIETKENFQASVFTEQTSLPTLDSRFQIKSLGEGFDAIISETDLAFTTASTTCLEFLATGSAVAIGCSVQNQESNYIKLGELGVASLAGKYFDDSWNINADVVLNLVISENMRSQLQEKARDYIDLNGAERIVDNIIDFVSDGQPRDVTGLENI